MSLFYNYHLFDEHQIQFKHPTKRVIGSEMFVFVPIRCKKQAIFIKTPKICVPFGLNRYTSEGGRVCYYYTLSFSDRDIDPQIDRFLDFLHKIEDFGQKALTEYSHIWGVPAVQFKSCLREYDGNSLLRLKITPSHTEIYDETDAPYTVCEEVLTSMIVKQCHIMSLLELSTLWISEHSYGLTWKVVQMKIYPPTRPLGGISLLGERSYSPTPINAQQPPPVEPLLPPPPPPPMPPPAMIRCLKTIRTGSFELKKTDRMPKAFQPQVSLEEILKIKRGLRMGVGAVLAPIAPQPSV